MGDLPRGQLHRKSEHAREIGDLTYFADPRDIQHLCAASTRARVISAGARVLGSPPPPPMLIRGWRDRWIEPRAFHSISGAVPPEMRQRAGSAHQVASRRDQPIPRMPVPIARRTPVHRARRGLHRACRHGGAVLRPRLGTAGDALMRLEPGRTRCSGGKRRAGGGTNKVAAPISRLATRGLAQVVDQSCEIATGGSRGHRMFHAGEERVDAGGDAEA